jgi:uncharacterized protein (DUF433 family)
MTNVPTAVHSDPETRGGEVVFIGTRVPLRILFEYLEAGDSLDVFLEDFPSVTRELAVGALRQAEITLTAFAMEACPLRRASS